MADSENKRGCGRIFIGAIAGIAIILVVAVISFVVDRKDKPSPAKRSENPYNAVETIPGIAAVDLHGNLTDRGFSLDKDLGSSMSTWTCEQRTSSYLYEATVYGRGPTEITRISAMVQDYSTGNLDAMAAEFLGFIATMPYDGASPAQARSWVESNVNRNTSTVIGGVKFEIFGNKDGSTTRMLDMSSASR